MPENTKEDQKTEEECRESPETPAAEDDQKTRSYYYDDACGYEIYLDDETDEANAEMEK
ncbi:MAG: hypothetical protein ABJA66_06570 [Actinomycetota bacterium]